MNLFLPQTAGSQLLWGPAPEPEASRGGLVLGSDNQILVLRVGVGGGEGLCFSNAPSQPGHPSARLLLPEDEKTRPREGRMEGGSHPT